MMGKWEIRDSNLKRGEIKREIEITKERAFKKVNVKKGNACKIFKLGKGIKKPIKK